MARVDMKWGGVYGSGSKGDAKWVAVSGGSSGKQRKARATRIATRDPCSYYFGLYRTFTTLIRSLIRSLFRFSLRKTFYLCVVVTLLFSSQFFITYKYDGARPGWKLKQAKGSSANVKSCSCNFLLRTQLYSRLVAF